MIQLIQRGAYRTTCLMIAGWLTSTAVTAEARPPGKLFPPSQPFKTGYLDVGDVHSIHYELHGNPRGKPFFVLHGGPGFGCYPRLTQYFDPQKFLIVLHDQRGAGQSRPSGGLYENTTPHLVTDIERLRKHFKIDDRVLIFGGSWGSTLALAYAETHPERVAGMVLRGIFTGTPAEFEQMLGEHGSRRFFPDAWAEFEAAWPALEGGFRPEALLKLVNEADEAAARPVIDAWMRYSMKVGVLHVSEEKLKQGYGDADMRPEIRIDCHYMINHWFMEDGQLLRDADKLKDIPITIINGRYDMICPPINAWRLHQRLPKSKLHIIAEAGHSEAEPGTTRALIEAVAAFE